MSVYFIDSSFVEAFKQCNYARKGVGSKLVSRQASTRKAFSRSHTLEGLVVFVSIQETILSRFVYEFKP